MRRRGRVMTGDGGAAPGAGDGRPRLNVGLSGKLVVLTALFVMIAQVLVYVPSIANYRITWLRDIHATAGVAALALASTERLPDALEERLLTSTGAIAIALKDGRRRLMLTRDAVPRPVDVHADLDHITATGAVLDAFDSLLFGSGRILRVTGRLAGSADLIEVVAPEDELVDAMLAYSRSVLLISLVISLVTACFVYWSLRRLTVRPLQRLAFAMNRFAEDPSDAERLIVPSDRRDEVGDAERHLRCMQDEMRRTLHQQRHLAQLGLAVSKINHDLRNLLASAQLFSDRLAGLPDPTVQRLAPKIVRALDRAVGYTQTVLSYGAVKEAPPERRLIRLRGLVEDVAEVTGLAQHSNIEFSLLVPRDLEVDADPDQLFRVLLNLVRNAIDALERDTEPSLVRRLTVSAERVGTVSVVTVVDTGPGVPARAREHMFQPFQGSTRAGGTGLGLCIAAELVRAHGGTIALVGGPPGAVFEITLPDRPVDLAAVRRAAGR